LLDLFNFICFTGDYILTRVGRDQSREVLCDWVFTMTTFVNNITQTVIFNKLIPIYKPLNKAIGKETIITKIMFPVRCCIHDICKSIVSEDIFLDNDPKMKTVILTVCFIPPQVWRGIWGSSGEDEGTLFIFSLFTI
jgi:hypothetical protein